VSERLRAVWAVVPVKAFARGKSRLGGVLTDPLRSAFARGLFEHVTGELARARDIAGVLVVSDDDEVAELARARGYRLQRDTPGATLAQVIDDGMSAVRELGASAALVCMADLPTLAASEVEKVVAALHEHAVIVAPDSHSAGTNLLCLAPPLAFPSCFGRADSFAQHLARAREHGFVPHTLRLPGLCFDVDGPDDLARI
jgi:2-phospho-L-lactate guanylyltransferase